MAPTNKRGTKGVSSIIEFIASPPKRGTDSALH